MRASRLVAYDAVALLVVGHSVRLHGVPRPMAGSPRGERTLGVGQRLWTFPYRHRLSIALGPTRAEILDGWRTARGQRRAGLRVAARTKHESNPHNLLACNPNEHARRWCGRYLWS